MHIVTEPDPMNWPHAEACQHHGLRYGKRSLTPCNP